MGQDDVGTYKLNPEAELALEVAQSAPWWPGFVDRYGSAGSAAMAIRKVVRTLTGEGVPIGDLTGAMAVATDRFLRVGEVPRNWESWLIEGARRRFRTPAALRELEPVEVIVGTAQHAERSRQAAAIGHTPPTPPPELAASAEISEPFDPSSSDGAEALAALRARMEASAATREADAAAEREARRASLRSKL